MTFRSKSTEHCRGCTDDFYNGRQNIGGGRCCWSLESAEVVTRYRIGVHTRPTSRDVFDKVRTYDCHREPGSYAFYTDYPPHLKRLPSAT